MTFVREVLTMFLSVEPSSTGSIFDIVDQDLPTGLLRQVLAILGVLVVLVWVAILGFAD